MRSRIDRLSESVYKLKAVADLLGAPEDERKLHEMTLRWIAILFDEELDRMEAHLEQLDTEFRAVGA